MTPSKYFILTIIFFIVNSCRQEKLPDFEKEIGQVTYIKTPLKFKDARPFIQYSYNRQIFHDSIFIKKGFVPCGIIKRDKFFYSLILIEPGIVNQPYLTTINPKGQIIDTLKLDQFNGRLNDSTERFTINYIIQNPDTILRIDTVKETTKSRYKNEIYEIVTTRWTQNAITFDTNGKIRK